MINRFRLEVLPLYPAALPATDPSPSQYLRALLMFQPTGPATLNAAVSADPDDPSRIILDRSTTVPIGGAYETLVKTTFNFSPDILSALRSMALFQLP